MEHLTHSAAETEALGCRLGCALAPGTVVAYRGGLGMGKTAFTRGLARGLDCRDRVTSPTFTIVKMCIRDSLKGATFYQRPPLYFILCI